MKEDTYKIRKFHKEKLIDEHEKAIAWHNNQIAKLVGQINRLTETFEKHLN